ncbi:MAG TPA: transcriptional regulator [Janthinobacterium sp.]|nr:transcriptional regulator [Janthinobacterium sp.]
MVENYEVSEVSEIYDLGAMRAAAAGASALLKAMANPDRLLLLCQLAHGERSVGELEGLLGLGQPSLSQQLGVLREEGLVATRRAGKRIFYRVASAPALAVLQLLYAQFCAGEEQA